MSDNRKRILFVDDEPKILDGLRRMLRNMRREWDMTFVTSGREALEAINKEPFDVVVSDMRMPEMDGAELLNRVRERCPTAVRLILSGHSEREMILKSVGPTHQFLAKPCDADSLKATVARACALRDLLGDEQLKAVVASVKTLPSVPLLYGRLLDVLGSPDGSLQEVAQIISSDVGMTAKVLQLVNSAFFGLRHHIESPAQAITYLGMDTVRAVVLTAGVFSEFEYAETAMVAAEELYPHSISVGSLAGKIARTARADQKLIDDVLMAGMLHDVGQLILAAELPEVWREAVRASSERKMRLHEAERELLGVTHAELGAYLLGLWGLPNPIVEAVAFHHQPSRCLSRAFTVLTPVHAADALVHEMNWGHEEKDAAWIDMAYLNEVGVAGRVPQWWELCRSTRAEEREHAGTDG